MTARPAWGRKSRARLLRAVLACLALTGLAAISGHAQTLESDFLRRPIAASRDLPLKASEGAVDVLPALPSPPVLPDPNQTKRRSEQAADSRIGTGPTRGPSAARGAGDSGYDPFNRKRRKPKYDPGQAKPKPSPGPGSPPPPPPPLNAAGQLRLSIPPSETANKQPIPPGMAGTVQGQPARRRLKLDDDPFGAVGDYAGPFLIKSAVELSGGYDTNPGRIFEPHGLPFWVIAPEFVAVSNWERHAVVADLRGTFTGYGGSLPQTIDGAINPAPTNVERPDFTGHADGRFDVSKDTDVTAQVRLRIATDNPGSPNIQTGLGSYPVYNTVGGTLGFDQYLNRLEFSGGATVDRTSYQSSVLTDRTLASNDDRNFNQYGGVGRVSYEVLPGLKPFVEVEGDRRVHDLEFDRNGFERDSLGGYAKAGTSFAFAWLLTGEVAVGWSERSYLDPRLNRLQGLLTSASLVWNATALTTAKFSSDTQIAETTLPGGSGVLVRTYTVEVDHDFRRWLTGIGKFTFGTYDYQGFGRNDKGYSIEGDLIYKMTRNLWIRGTLRRDLLDSNIPLSSSNSTVVMLGVRLQN